MAGTDPPLAPPSTEQKFLGIPQDFSVQRPGVVQIGQYPGEVIRGDGPNDYSGQSDKPIRQPDGSYTWSTGERVYVPGDEFRPGQGGDPVQISTIQEQLVQAGLIKKGQKFRAGVWDEPTRDAYKKLLEYANGRGVADWKAMTDLISAPMVDLPNDRQPLEYQLPDPEDLKFSINKTSRSVLGRALDPEALERLSAAYISELQRTQQTNYNNNAVTTATQSDTEMPDEQQLRASFTEQQLRATNPGEATAHDFSGAYEEFSSLLRSSAANVKQY